jgi:uncharacterized protein YcfJ
MKIFAYAPVTMALGVVLLAGCVSPPTGPNVTALPGTGKTYEQFMADDNICQNYARGHLNQATQQANNNAVGSAVGGTLIGTAGGALLGAASGHAAAGAAIGAGSGLLLGSAIGNDNAMQSNGDIQHRYNSIYIQCMYAKGDRVPMPAGSIPASASEVPPDYYPADRNVPPDYYPAANPDVPPDYVP